MKICEHGAETINKTWSFKVSIGLVPLISIVSSKEGWYPSYRSLMKICQHGTEILNKTCSFKVSIWILSLISIVSSNESLL